MKILVLPGMGDIYWVFVKLQSFLQCMGETERPLIYTWEIQPQKLNRSADYIQRVPFVKYGGSWIHTQNTPGFNDIYFGTTWGISPFKEFDYLLSCNGILRNGYHLEYGPLDQYKSDWYFPLTDSIEEQQTIDFHREHSGKYIVAYFTDDGMYSKTWLKHLPLTNIYTLLQQIHEQTQCKIVLTGGQWDTEFNKKLHALDTKGFIANEVGTTTINQLFGLIKQSVGMIGWCGGNTVMSTVFKKPTVIMWSNYFPNDKFFTNCVPPDSVDKWYKPKVIERDNVSNIAQTMIDLISRTT